MDGLRVYILAAFNGAKYRKISRKPVWASAYNPSVNLYNIKLLLLKIANRHPKREK